MHDRSDGNHRRAWLSAPELIDCPGGPSSPANRATGPGAVLDDVICAGVVPRPEALEYPVAARRGTRQIAHVDQALQTLARARNWVAEDVRMRAALIHGSVVQSAVTSLSDLDLIVIAEPGQRDSIWDDRERLTRRLLGGPAAVSEVLPQRAYRWQARTADLDMLDFTIDEGHMAVWNGFEGPVEFLIDRADVRTRFEQPRPGRSDPSRHPGRHLRSHAPNSRATSSKATDRLAACNERTAEDPSPGVGPIAVPRPPAPHRGSTVRFVSVTALWTNDRWQVVEPKRPVSAGHLAIVDRSPMNDVDRAGAAALIDAYRRARSALWKVVNHRGFMVSFAMDWQPDLDAIGEPEAIDGESRVIHVFGRGAANDAVSPVRVMASPAGERPYSKIDPARSAELARALEEGAAVEIVGPSDRECDGCSPQVLTSQERWRADGVRVIRPRSVAIDAQVIVLPLRHVVSIGDLHPDEVTSIFARLGEVLAQFNMASHVTGLSCFANDGTAARQETPHVHLHVLGRSKAEAANPFALLGRQPQPAALGRRVSASRYT